MKQGEVGARPGNGRVIELRDILDLIPGADSEWRILEFEATGEASAGHSLSSLDSAALASPDGVPISWTDLLQLASKLEQTINALLEGKRVSVGSNANTESTSSELVVSIEALDGTYWILKVFADGEPWTEVMAAFARLTR